MADLVTGSTRRRRPHRMRSWWRHEAQSVRAALATAHHHSFETKEVVEHERGGGCEHSPAGTDGSSTGDGTLEHCLSYLSRRQHSHDRR